MNSFETPKERLSRNLGVDSEKIKNLLESFSHEELNTIKASLVALKNNSESYIEKTKIDKILDFLTDEILPGASDKKPDGYRREKALKLEWVFSEVQFETIAEALGKKYKNSKKRAHIKSIARLIIKACPSARKKWSDVIKPKNPDENTKN